jgi:replicative DNA helicase
MTKEQFFSRMLSQVSRIPSFKIRRAWLLTDEEEKQLARSAAEIAGWPWYIADRSNPHITEVVSRAVAAVKHRKCELIALDHIQKFRADGDNETERTSAISAALAQLAKDYAPVVALSQLTKPADHSKAKWPTALDLRGSGMLEADAHTIVLLHRDLDQGGQYASKGYAIVEKQREGMTGVLNVHFDTDLLRLIRA